MGSCPRVGVPGQVFRRNDEGARSLDEEGGFETRPYSWQVGVFRGSQQLEAEVAALVGEVAGDCGYQDYDNQQEDVEGVEAVQDGGVAAVVEEGGDPSDRFQEIYDGSEGVDYVGGDGGPGGDADAESSAAGDGADCEGQGAEGNAKKRGACGCRGKIGHAQVHANGEGADGQ